MLSCITVLAMYLSLFVLIMSVPLVHSQEPCNEEEVLCEGTLNECIKENYVCDGAFMDCSNGWDEMDCPCDEEEIKCRNSTECILPSWVCDGVRDCSKGEDESNCPCVGEFRCEDSRCIPLSWVCDSVSDCENGEDESAKCPQCDGCNDGKCISKDWHCDGIPDCKQKEDEFECPCNQFVCKSGVGCIANYLVCNGSPDCDDGSDENDCPQCDSGEISCVGKCVSEHQICDAIKDCPDGEDESRCIYLRKPVSTERLRIESKKRHSIYLKEAYGIHQSPDTLKFQNYLKAKELKQRKRERYIE